MKTESRLRHQMIQAIQTQREVNMPTKTWTCHHSGHEIKVQNYWNFLLWGRERLYIDGKLADEQQGWGFVQPRFSVTLLGKLKTAEGDVREVKALIGQAKMGLSHDCKIWIESDLVFPEHV